MRHTFTLMLGASLVLGSALMAQDVTTDTTHEKTKTEVKHHGREVKTKTKGDVDGEKFKEKSKSKVHHDGEAVTKTETKDKP